MADLCEQTLLDRVVFCIVYSTVRIVSYESKLSVLYNRNTETTLAQGICIPVKLYEPRNLHLLFSNLYEAKLDGNERASLYSTTH